MVVLKHRLRYGVVGVSDCFRQADVPDGQLAEIFPIQRLKAVFPLVLRGLDWTKDKATELAQDLRPMGALCFRRRDTSQRKNFSVSTGCVFC